MTNPEKGLYYRGLANSLTDLSTEIVDSRNLTVSLAEQAPCGM
jgi:hypothetical protein